jgi:carboxypeptidase D
MYCPYIASNMLDANDTTYFDVQGMLIYDPAIEDDAIDEAPIRYFVDYWANLFPFNDTTKAQLANASETCGYDAFTDHYLSFPPPGPQPVAAKLPGMDENGTGLLPECEIFNFVMDAIFEINPGWNVYQVAQLLPVPDDVLGFPYSSFYTAPGREIYFNRTDVKKAINAPLDVDWQICSAQSVFAGSGDTSDPSSYAAIPYVIDRTRNVQIAHGSLDFVLLANATLLAIQNMTWGGAQGFQSVPAYPLFVPHHDNPSVAGMSGQGVLGTWHEERGLTWALIELTGHMVPTWQAAVAFRQIEVLLGRVSALNSTVPFPMYANSTQPDEDELGGGTGAPVQWDGKGAAGSGTSCSTVAKSNTTSAPLSAVSSKSFII